MKPNMILRDKIKLSNCKDYNKIELSKFDLQVLEFVCNSFSKKKKEKRKKKLFVIQILIPAI